MQYEIDMNSQYKDIFKKLESIILSYKNIKVVKNAKQTSYSDEYKVVVMLRVSSDKKYFVSSWGCGSKLANKYKQLSGNGKIVRQINFQNLDDINEKLIKEIIEESMVLNMEHYELQELRKRK